MFLFLSNVVPQDCTPPLPPLPPVPKFRITNLAEHCTIDNSVTTEFFFFL